MRINYILVTGNLNEVKWFVEKMNLHPMEVLYLHDPNFLAGRCYEKVFLYGTWKNRTIEFFDTLWRWVSTGRHEIIHIDDQFRCQPEPEYDGPEPGDGDDPRFTNW